MTASFMRATPSIVPEQFLQRLTDLTCLPLEQMVGAIDDDELLRLFELAVERPHGFQRANFVTLSLHKEFRLRAGQGVWKLVVHPGHRRGDWRGDPDER